MTCCNRTTGKWIRNIYRDACGTLNRNASIPVAKDICRQYSEAIVPISSSMTGILQWVHILYSQKVLNGSQHVLLHMLIASSLTVVENMGLTRQILYHVGPQNRSKFRSLFTSTNLFHRFRFSRSLQSIWDTFKGMSFSEAHFPSLFRPRNRS